MKMIDLVDYVNQRELTALYNIVANKLNEEFSIQSAELTLLSTYMINEFRTGGITIEMVTVTLENCNSKYFPVIARWKINGVSNSDVFETKDAAINHLSGRFGKIQVIDKTKGVQK